MVWNVRSIVQIRLHVVNLNPFLTQAVKSSPNFRANMEVLLPKS